MTKVTAIKDFQNEKAIEKIHGLMDEVEELYPDNIKSLLGEFRSNGRVKENLTTEERNSLMEECIIGIEQVKDPDGKAICIPYVRQISNIYRQAEDVLYKATHQTKDKA